MSYPRTIWLTTAGATNEELRMTFLPVNNKLWLISDTHFGHRNIVRYQQRPASHEAIMLSEWIRRVGDDDAILHLGDVWLGPRSSDWRWAAIVSRLPGRKFLVKGNHDRSKPHMYEQAGFTVVPPFIYRGIAFTHRPVSFEWPIDGDWKVNIHGHTHANPYRPAHDGTLLERRKYLNVSVEATNFMPVQLGNVFPIPKEART